MNPYLSHIKQTKGILDIGHIKAALEVGSHQIAQVLGNLGTIAACREETQSKQSRFGLF